MNPHRAVRFIGAIVAASFASVAAAESIRVEATPVPLSPDAPEVRSVGPLHYRGGLWLRSGDPRFGGFSGLGVSADGSRLVSVSDRGMSLSLDLTYENGQLAGVANADLGSLADEDGSPLQGRYFTDAEAMSPGVQGEIIIAFEGKHRIWRYLPGEVQPRPLPLPVEAEGMPENAGIEALTLLDDGRLLAFAEGSERGNTTLAWVSDQRGWNVMTYAISDGFRPTGAATLPDGDVAVLERYYTPRNGVRVRVKRLAASTVAPGAELKGEIIATLAPPMNVDNFEGIEARRGPSGETLIYLISDDNFSDRQRTYLMMFEWRRP